MPEHGEMIDLPNCSCGQVLLIQISNAQVNAVPKLLAPSAVMCANCNSVLDVTVTVAVTPH
jgi:hypothetical protein